MYPSSNYSPNISSSSSLYHINIPSPSMQYEPEFIQYFHDLHCIQPALHDQNNIDTNIMAEGNSDKLDKPEEDQEDQLVLPKGCKNKKEETSSTTTSAIRRKNNKRTASSGAGVGASKKDRHSKINTRHGPRDRRMRLSLEIARKFFNLQDLLGFDKASKTVEWLLTKSKSAVNELVQKMNKEKCSGTGTTTNTEGASSPSDSCEVISGVIDESAAINITDDVIDKQQKKRIKSTRRTIFHRVVAKESRMQARERARERTKIKKSLNDKNMNDIGKSMVDDGNSKKSLGSNWSTFEDHQSGIHQGYNNTNNIMDIVDSFSLMDTSNWSPFLFNYQQINTEISQEVCFNLISKRIILVLFRFFLKIYSGAASIDKLPVFWEVMGSLIRARKEVLLSLLI